MHIQIYENTAGVILTQETKHTIQVLRKVLIAISEEWDKPIASNKSCVMKPINKAINHNFLLKESPQHIYIFKDLPALQRFCFNGFLLQADQIMISFSDGFILIQAPEEILNQIKRSIQPDPIINKERWPEPRELELNERKTLQIPMGSFELEIK